MRGRGEGGAMSPDSFDPTPFNSAAECVQALKELGVTLGHRLGARVFGLGRRGLRFSLAFLDEAASPGAAQELLMAPVWSGSGPLQPEQVQEALRGREAVLVFEGSTCHVLTPDEAQIEAPLARSSGSLLPAVLGASDPASFQGVLWDRRRMEEAALTLLDAEEPAELLEAFRYLFRATTVCGQDPAGLVVTALRRGRPELSREVASQVRESLDRDFGRALGDLLSEEPSGIRDALHFFIERAAQGHAGILEAVLLPALTPLLGRPEFREHLLPRLPRLACLVGTEPAPLESFLDSLLACPDELELHERFAISAFLVDLGARYAGLAGYLLRRTEATADPHQLAWLGSILARVRLDPGQHERVVARLVALFREEGEDETLRRRLRVTFRTLGPEPLARLSDPGPARGLSLEQRTWLVHLWQDYRTAQSVRPPDPLFVDFACREILSRNRSALLALVRTGQLTRPELLEGLRASPEPRGTMLGFLLDEAWRMEEPDDLPVLEALAAIGPEALEQALVAVREEVALESGGEAGRVALLGRLARRMELGPAELERLREILTELLEQPFLGAEALPGALAALGELGGIPGLDAEVQLALVERLADPLERFPKARVDALLAIYPSGAHPVRRRIEEILRSVLGAPEPDRKVLRACLEGLEGLFAEGPLLLEAESLVAELCRTILRKGQPESLEALLRETLSEAARGDGVRVPAAWNRQDRDQALRILGALACHRETPDRLHRMVVVRLFSFLDDWLRAVEGGRDLYACRETPLWEILGRLLADRPGEVGFALAREAAVRVLELHSQHPQALALARRENTQRFLLSLVAGEHGETVVRGVRVDLARVLLRTLMDLALQAQGENRVTEYLLRELASSRDLPEGLRRELESFLARLEP